MLLVFLISCYLLLIQYGESLTCGRRTVEDYASYKFQPYIIWDLSEKYNNNITITNFMEKVDQQLEFTTQENGLRNFFDEAIKFAGTQDDVARQEQSLNASLEKWGEAFYNSAITPLVQAPPTVMKAVTIKNKTAIDALAFIVSNSQPLPYNEYRYRVQWPIIFTDKAPTITTEADFKKFLTMVTENFNRLTVVTLYSPGLTALWKPSFLEKHQELADYLSIKQITEPLLVGNQELGTEALKHIVNEMNGAICAKFEVASNLLLTLGLKILSVAEIWKNKIYEFSRNALNSVSTGPVLASSGGLLALLFVGGGSYWMYRRRGVAEKASIVTDDQDDWNNFSYEDNGEPKLYLDGADRQNSMEWIQLK